jgi:putative transcriptional regulator
MKTIELQIDRVLKERGKSAYWLSHQTGIDESALVRLRKQKTKGIQWKTLLPLCEALECEPGDLIVLVEGKPEPRKKAGGKK